MQLAIGQFFAGQSIETFLVTDGRVRFLAYGRCPGCGGLVVGVDRYSSTTDDPSGILLWPPDVRPDRAPDGLEPHVKRVYDEARQILSLSPKGAAVLVRHCLQHVLRTKLGLQRRTLFDEIQEAMSRQQLTKPTRDALDHIREIGNWGAHPVESGADPAETIIEVTIEEAEYTLDVLELLFHDLYSLPDRIEAMRTGIKARAPEKA